MIVKLKNTETDLQILVSYLHDVDSDFGIPLSNRVDLNVYARKLLEFGHVFVVQEGDNYLALSAVYCNNKKISIAYLPILSVKKESRGKGYAQSLVREIVNVSSMNSMHKIRVDSINPIAVKLYEKMGFNSYKIECHGCFTKFFLELKLL